MGPTGCPEKSVRYYHSALPVMSQIADLNGGWIIICNAAAAADDDDDDDRQTSLKSLERAYYYTVTHRMSGNSSYPWPCDIG
jgi:hypothetical protein